MLLHFRGIWSCVLHRIPLRSAPFQRWHSKAAGVGASDGVEAQRADTKDASDPQPGQQAPSFPTTSFIQKQIELKKKEYKNLPEWKKRTISTKERYGQWNPTRKLSRDQMESVRSIKEQVPLMKVAELATHFNISPEAIRRILKSKWVPNTEQRDRMDTRAVARKSESNLKRDQMSEEISLARKRMTYGKSVELESVLPASQTANHSRRPLPDKSSNFQMAKTIQTFTSKDGKFLYDSGVSHLFYKSKKRRNGQGAKRDFRRRPFSENVGDLIE